MPPLVLVAIAWVAGLLAAHHGFVPLGVEPLSLVLVSLIPIAAIVLWPEDRQTRMAGICTLAFLAAALRYQSALPDLDNPGLLAHYNDRGWVELEGVVGGYPDVRDTWTNLKVKVEWVELEGERHAVRGTVLVRAPRFPEHVYGDRVRVSGILETPPEFEDFDYRDYHSQQKKLVHCDC